MPSITSSLAELLEPRAGRRPSRSRPPSQRPGRSPARRRRPRGDLRARRRSCSTRTGARPRVLATLASASWACARARLVVTAGRPVFPETVSSRGYPDSAEARARPAAALRRAALLQVGGGQCGNQARPRPGSHRRSARAARGAGAPRRVPASEVASAASRGSRIEVNPCARVSWISRASRSRSASTPRPFGLREVGLGPVEVLDHVRRDGPSRGSTWMNRPMPQRQRHVNADETTTVVRAAAVAGRLSRRTTLSRHHHGDGHPDGGTTRQQRPGLWEEGEQQTNKKSPPGPAQSSSRNSGHASAR